MDRDTETPSAVRMRRWVPLVLVVCSVVAGVVLSEICHRIMRRFVCVGIPQSGTWRVDPVYGWGHRPNHEQWFYSCLGRRYEWRAYNRINSLGLRDRERTYERQPGIPRVLLLGDSITEGLQVPLENTFAALLESKLRASGTPVEVINAGVAAFGPDNAWLFFRSEGVRYRPDVVVLVFNVVNDIAESSAVLDARTYAANPERLIPKTYFRLDADGALLADVPPRHEAVPVPVPWWKQIEARVYLVRAIRRLVTRPAPVVPPLPGKAAAPAPDFLIQDVENAQPEPEWAEAWRVTEALVRALRTDVERSGARFAVAVMPSREAVSDAAWQTLQRFFPKLRAASYDPAYPVARMTAFLAREGIPTLSLLPPLRSAAERTGQTGYFGWDIHLDKPGHVVVADALAPFVAELVSTR